MAPALLAAGGATRATASCGAGRGWTRLTRLKGYEMVDVAFRSRCDGIAVGAKADDPAAGAILVTADGGRSFAAARTPAREGALRAIAATGELAWAAGAGGVLRSIDGGRSWTRARIPSGTDPLSGVSFADRRHGFAVGARTLLVSSDGGMSWTRRPTPEGAYLVGVASLGPKRAWAVGRDSRGGAVFVSGDGARSWHDKPVAVPDGTLFRVQFVDARHGWAVGAASPGTGGKGLLVASADGGRTWRRIAVRRTSSVVGLHFATPQRGWVAVYATGGQIRSTRDGGRTWTTQLAGATVGPGPIDFVGGRAGWMIGSFGLFATGDGGVR